MMSVAGTVRAVCASEAKGTAKVDVGRAAFVADWGIVGDAHAGPGLRQVSLLSLAKIEEFRRRGVEAPFGAFGENLVVEGLDLAALPVGAVLRAGEVEMVVTQIGKECHRSCAIRERVGDCIMPREGVFARVLHGGTIAAGDALALVGPGAGAGGGGRVYRAAIVTASDSGARGERVDESGREVRRIVEAAGFRVTSYAMLPDDQPRLEAELRRLCDEGLADLVLTTGGTGFSPRDCTPEATLAVIERRAPGISEAIRAASMVMTRRAMLSRAEAGLRGRSLIINLPGSPKAVRESLEAVIGELGHGLDILTGAAGNCASS